MLTFLRNSVIRRVFSTFYNIDHEYIKYNPKTKVGVVGITEYAHKTLGDIIFVQMPDVGTKFKQGDVLGKLESTRIVDDIYCPLSGEIVEVNKKIIECPDLINDGSDSDDEGWLVKIKIDNLAELDNLYDKSDYEKLVKQLKRKHSI